MTPSANVSSAAMLAPAQALVDQLRSRNEKIALAESCTCGMAAALIGGVPGASDVFCGSSVTYRASVKRNWLGVGEDLIQRHSTESREVTSAMAIGLLKSTPEADWAAAITGHLGPNAPAEKDGAVFVSVLARAANNDPAARTETLILKQADRIARQIEAAERWLMWISQNVLDCE